MVIGYAISRNNIVISHLICSLQRKTREKAIVDAIDYQMPVTQLRECKGDEDIRAAKQL